AVGYTELKNALGLQLLFVFATLERARLEQRSQIGRIGGVAKEREVIARVHAEDFLHRAQERRVAVLDAVRVGQAIHVLVRILRDDDEGNGELRGVPAFRFVPPQQDRGAVLVSG